MIICPNIHITHWKEELLKWIAPTGLIKYSEISVYGYSESESVSLNKPFSKVNICSYEQAVYLSH